MYPQDAEPFGEKPLKFIDWCSLVPTVFDNKMLSIVLLFQLMIPCRSQILCSCSVEKLNILI